MGITYTKSGVQWLDRKRDEILLGNVGIGLTGRKVGTWVLERMNG